MDRIGLVLVDLEPVAGGVAYSQDARGLGMLEGVEDGEGRAFLRRTHVGEHQAPPHLDGIGALAELVANRAVGGLPGGVEDGAVDVEVPAVVAAADTALLQPCRTRARCPGARSAVPAARCAHLHRGTPPDPRRGSGWPAEGHRAPLRHRRVARSGAGTPHTAFHVPPGKSSSSEWPSRALS